MYTALDVVAAPSWLIGWYDCGLSCYTEFGLYRNHDELAHHTAAHYGIRSERYKLIYFYNDGMGIKGTTSTRWAPEWELFDLQEDPGEVHNVYHDEAYARVRDEMTRRLWRLQAEVGDRPHPSQPVPPGCKDNR